MSTKKTISIIATVVVLGLGGVAGYLAARTTPSRPVAETADEFMSALRQRSYRRAWELCSPSLRNELRRKDRLATAVARHSPAPVDWSFSTHTVESRSGHVRGGVHYEGGIEGVADLVLVKVGDNWRVEQFMIE